MPLFYLHVYNRTGVSRDEEGEELDDVSQAHRRAIEGIRSILSDEASQGMLDLRGRVEIVSETGAPLATVPFAEAFELHLESEQA